MKRIPAKKKELAAQKKEFEAEKKKPGERHGRYWGQEKGVQQSVGKTVNERQGDIASLDKKISSMHKAEKDVAESEKKLTNDRQVEQGEGKIAATGFVDFERRITQDMDTRAVLAKTSPQAAYTPEPNLFVDAIATKSTRHQVR